VVLDSDVVSLLWRKRLPNELYHRLPLLTRNRKDFEPLEEHGLILL
jgi:hypothetical protein